MEIRHLESLAAATELSSFTRAAERLSLTQAAVSQHIAALERELGTKLFVREGRAVTPTEAGRRLHEYACRILELMAEATREVGHAETELHGTLRIATSTVPSEVLLPELLQRFRERYPQVRESVTVSDSVAATAALQRGEAELAFVGELPRSPQLTARPVAKDELVLVVSPSHALAQRHWISLKRLADEPLVVRETGSGSRRCVEQTLEAAGLAVNELSIAVETNSNDAIRAAVKRGIGVAFLSRTSVARELDEGELVTVSVRGLHAVRKLYLVTDSGRARSPAARAFVEMLSEERMD